MIKESTIRATVLSNLLKSLRKGDAILVMPRILSFISLTRSIIYHPLASL